MRRRSISFLAVSRLLARKKFTRSNTKVRVNEDGTAELFLFGNKIAIYKPNNDLYISFAGWVTNTTYGRLASFPSVIINRRGGVLSINGKIVNPVEWVYLYNIEENNGDYHIN